MADESLTEYGNSQISKLIDEYIHNSRERDILKRKFIDGDTYESLAEEFGYSVQNIKRIVYKSKPCIFKYI